MAQLQSSLVHMLALAQASDAPRLREPLQRRKQQLVRLIKQAAAHDAAEANQHAAAYAAATGLEQQQQGSKQQQLLEQASGSGGNSRLQQALPSDPFSQGATSPVGAQQPQVGHQQHPAGMNGVAAGSIVLHSSNSNSMDGAALVMNNTAAGLPDSKDAAGAGLTGNSKAQEAMQQLAALLGDADLLRNAVQARA